jgi:5-methylcytosine-specific restriction endonuclease McrA
MASESPIYHTLRWRLTRSRALERDGHRCTVSQLLGGPCSGGPLHAHHIVPVSEGGAAYDLDNVGTSCSSHHPMWEALRRTLVRRLAAASAPPPRCPHQHRSAEARRICEARLARRHRDLAAA